MTDTTDPADQPNEILAAAAAAKAHAEAAAEAVATSVADKAKHWPVAAISLGVGIGSAAITAAALFASRRSK